MNLFKKLSKLPKLDRNFKKEDRIYRNIEKLKRDRIDWQSVLNREAIWLFIAFISVWSLPVLPLASHRSLVATLLLAIFSKRIEAEKKKSKRIESFPKIINEIES